MKLEVLKPLPVLDKEEIAGMLKELSDLNDQGKLKALVTAYISDKGLVYVSSSRTTEMGQLALAIEALRRYLSKWMDKHE